MTRKIEAKVVGFNEEQFRHLEAVAEANGRTVEQEITALVGQYLRAQELASALHKPGVPQYRLERIA